MKKTFLSTLLAVMLCSVSSFAQINTAPQGPEVSFGLRMGLNFSMLSGGVYDSYEPRSSLVRGAYLIIPLSERIYLEPGLNYSQEGGNTTEETLDGHSEKTLKLNYVDFPMLVRYEIGNGFHAFGGPEIGVNVFSEIESHYDTVEPQPVDDVNATTFSLMGGFGYEFENKLNLRASFSRSLSPVITYEEAGIDDTYSNVLQLALGYTF